MAEKPRYDAIARIDPDELASFQTAIRKRYSDEQILAELLAYVDRHGRSPTMKEFAADPETKVHPQTVIEHFGTWNAAKRAAGLVPRRFATREELVDVLRRLGEELGRTPTAKDLDERRGRMPSKSLYWHTFGSLSAALREAGFDVAVGEERLERAVEQGAELARETGRLPKFADWAAAQARTARDADRVAGLPDVRLAPRRVGDVPVPRPAAARRAGRRRALRRLARSELGRRDDRGEPREADLALLRRPHGRERIVLDVAHAGGSARDGRPCRRSRESNVPSATSRLRSLSRQ